MSGLANICKAYGSVVVNGETWIWDYKAQKPRLKSEIPTAKHEPKKRIKKLKQDESLF